MDELIKLQENAPQRDALRSFMEDTLRTMAADRAIRGEDVSGFPEAFALIGTLFEELDALASK